MSELFKGVRQICHPQRDLRKAVVGFAIACVGAIGAVVLMLEKTNNYVLGIGTGLTEVVAFGIAFMAPGIALILHSFIPQSVAVAVGDAEWTDALASRPSPLIRAIFGLLVLLAGLSIVAIVRLSFGIPGPSGTFSLPLSEPVRDLFHEGEIIGSIGLFPDGVRSELPLLIHGPGRNLLPSWLALQMGERDNMIVEMRFVTAAGRFYVAAITATAAAIAATMIAKQQTLVRLERVECLAIGLVAAAATITLLTFGGRITSREVAVCTVSLFAITLIWAAGAARNGVATILAGLLGAVVFLSPLHTYLGAVQSVAIAMATAAIALWISRTNRLQLVLGASLGAGTAFGLIVALGMSEIWSASLAAIFYWSEAGQEIWATNLTVLALLKTPLMTLAAATLGGLALAGPKLGLENRSVRGALALYSVIILASVLSFSNRPLGPQIGHALVIAAPAYAAALALLFLVLRRFSLKGVLLIACVITTISVTRAITLQGNTLSDALNQISTNDAAVHNAEALAFHAEFRSELDQLDCLLIMSNEGALAYAARLPPCGPAFYPIYLNAERDGELANWLLSNPQVLIVSGSDSYWSRIDGRTMRERVPQTYAVIDDLYPVSRTFEIWEVRFPVGNQ
jgi:hypothetical protein